MKKEVTTMLRKTAKIAGVTCIALGGAAFIASGAALKALTEGAQYLKDSVKKIVAENPNAGDITVDAVTEESPAEEPTDAENLNANNTPDEN